MTAPPETIEGVDETPAGQASSPAGPQRTPAGDALVHGSSLAVWTAVVAIIGHAAGLDPVWWTIGVAAVALVLVSLARWGHGANAVAAWWVLSGSVWAGWLAWSAWVSLRGPVPWLVLAGGWLVAVATYPLAHKSRQNAERARKRREAEQARNADANRWPRLLQRIGYHGVRVLARDETRNGYALLLRLPATGGTTWRKLAGDTEKLEAAADVRHGSLRFEPGETARNVILSVSTRDVLGETVPYTDDGQPLSIRNPIPVGLYEDGTVCSLTLREVCVLIVGLRGSGKSTLLNLLIAQLARCVDCLILLNDTKHRLAMPWVTPYLTSPPGQWPPVMPVEWVATDRDETERMLAAVLRGIRARAASGSGGEKIEPLPHEPAVIVIADEAASIFGEGRGPRYSDEGTTNATLAATASEAVQLGRSEATDFIIASQRGTVSMVGSGDMKSQFAIRIGLRVISEADASYVIPDDQQAAKILAGLRHAGTGVLIEDRDARVAPVKFFRIQPHQIEGIARRYGPLKPDPDPVLRAAWGDDYETRWDRFRAGRKMAPAVPDPDREFEAITARLADVEEAAGDTATKGRQLMREFMARSGDRGVTVSMITDRLRTGHIPVSERTVRRWLGEDTDNGIIERISHLLYRMRRPDAA
ncbi:MAG: ATP-binding protein [Streptosporangiaceae bacterium]